MVKRMLLIGCASLALVGAAHAQTEIFYKGIINIEVPTGGIPIAVAKDDAGALYIATFASPDSTVIKIDDPEAAIDDSGGFPAATGTVLATASGFVASRGFQGIAVDSNGNVFAAGDNGGGTPQGIIRKWDSSGTADTTFNTAADTANIRAGGLALLSDDSVAVAQFGGFTLRSTTDFDAIGAASTGNPNFGREVSYNANDNIVYLTRSGGESAVKVAGYFQGGTPAAGGYSWVADALIPDGAIDTQFGLASSHGGFDNDRSWFLDAANGLTPQALRIFEVTEDGTDFELAFTLDGDTLDAADGGQPFPITDVRDAIIIGDFIYVASSNNSGSIYAFEIVEITSVQNWNLY